MAHPTVKQTSTDDDNINYETPGTIEDYFAVINTFLNGMEIASFIPNARACSDASMDFALALEYTRGNVPTSDFQTDTVNALKAYTTLISTHLAKAQLEC